VIQDTCYSQKIAPFWGFQAGVRQDFQQNANRTCGVIGLQGLAPYFFEIGTALFIGVNWNKNFVNTADFARNEGKETHDLRWEIGVRAWF
jgi:uncharacterized protein involved in copper resistance|tara:strand:+ start:1188 stop:1457 length:270 start_codon:yes stop_codon:yes gene_type:complete